jgi:protein transport protein SEC23
LLCVFSAVDFQSKHWTCPFCFTRNAMSQYYAENISPERLPAELMPEYTTMDFILPTRPACPPGFLYVVDACAADEELEALKDSILQSLELLPPTALVGLVTFGTMVQVHEMISASDCPRSYVFRGTKEYDASQVASLLGLTPIQAGGGGAVGGGGPAGPPAPSTASTCRFLMPVSTASSVIASILKDLPRDPWPKVPADRDSRATGAALSISVSLMERALGKQGGRVMLFTSGACTVGPGNVVARSKKEVIRGHSEITKDLAPLFKPACAFYKAIADRAKLTGQAIDYFACALDQTGLMELKPCVSSTGGMVVLADSFSQSVFKESFVRLFRRWEEDAKEADAGHLKMGFGATLEVHTSKEFKVSGAIGACTSLKRAANNVSTTEVGEGGTNTWSLGALDSTTSVAIFFDVTNAAGAVELDKRHHLQIITYYQHASGRQRMRVTTCSGMWNSGNDAGSLASLAASFDQQAAAVAMSRIAVHRTDSEELGEILRWLDRSLIRLCAKFAQYRKDDPGSFLLSPNFSLYPQFMFNLRRSQFMQTFGLSPDEATYSRLVFIRENVENSLLMVQPSLLSWSMANPFEPVAVQLDATSVRPDSILLMDTFFQVLIFHGEQISAWRDQKYADQPGYEAWGHTFKELLQSPLKEATSIMGERFPQPRYILCDQHKSQARFLMARLNPSITHTNVESSAAGSAPVITDDVSFNVFMEHLMCVRQAVAPPRNPPSALAPHAHSALALPLSKLFFPPPFLFLFAENLLRKHSTFIKKNKNKNTHTKKRVGWPTT